MEPASIVTLTAATFEVLNKAVTHATGKSIEALTGLLLKKVYKGFCTGMKAVAAATDPERFIKRMVNDPQLLIRQLPAQAVLTREHGAMKRSQTATPTPSSNRTYRCYDDVRSPSRESLVTSAPLKDTSYEEAYLILRRLERKMKAFDEKLQDLTESLQTSHHTAPMEIEYSMNRLSFVNNHLHIAVAGCTGSGKSSFINAIRGLDDDDPSAAPVGHLETTLEVTRYLVPHGSARVVWYDVPGAGTRNTPCKNYFKNQDLDIMQSCYEYNIPCLLVRSKCDLHLDEFRHSLKHKIKGISDLSKLSNTITHEFSEKVRQLQTETIAVGRKALATLADHSSKRQSIEASTFLINKFSLQKLVAKEQGDENSIDEERLFHYLSQAMAA